MLEKEEEETGGIRLPDSQATAPPDLTMILTGLYNYGELAKWSCALLHFQDAFSVPELAPHTMVVLESVGTGLTSVDFIQLRDYAFN